MSHPTRVPPTSLRAQAYESFQQQIVEANIRPGQFISQRELMQLLGMPLGAVRELIPRLEAEGLLHTVPQRGLQIAHVDIKLINNAFQLRLLLEREAAIRFTTSVSDADLATIENAHLQIVRRARSGQIDDALLSDATMVDWGLHDLMIGVGRPEALRVKILERPAREFKPALVDVLVGRIHGNLLAQSPPRLKLPFPHGFATLSTKPLAAHRQAGRQLRRRSTDWFLCARSVHCFPADVAVVLDAYWDPA